MRSGLNPLPPAFSAKLLLSGDVRRAACLAMTASSETIIFLHIPRTGGTTLQRIPERNYGRDRIRTFYEMARADEVERFAGLPEAERAKYKFIKGHVYFGFHELVPGSSSYATFLREPISRAFSFYEYARTHRDHYLYPAISRQELSLETLLEQEATPELFNLQTRMIAGCSCETTPVLDHSILARAKENLRSHFCFVGLTEAFDASLVLLARILDWRVPYYVRRNSNWKKSAPNEIGDKRTNALLRDANALDLELYAFAQGLFEERLQQAGDSVELEFRRFRKLNFFGGHACEYYHNFVRNLQQITGRRPHAASGATLTESSTDSTL